MTDSSQNQWRKELEAAKEEIKGEIRSKVDAAKEEIMGEIRSSLNDLRDEMIDRVLQGRVEVAAEEVVDDYETRRKAKFKLLDSLDETNNVIIEWLSIEENTTWLSKDLISGPGKLDWDKQNPKKWTGPLLKRLLSEKLLEERQWTSPYRTPREHKRLPNELHDFIISVIKKGTGINVEEDIELVMHKKLAKVFVAAALAKKKREGIPTKKVVKKARKLPDQAEDLGKVNEAASTSKNLADTEEDEKMISSSDEELAKEKADPGEKTASKTGEKTASKIAQTKKSGGRPKKRAAKEQADIPKRQLRSRK